MTFVVADRVKETSTSTGTGAFTLAGAMTGFSAFSARCSVGDTLYYAIQAVDGSGSPTGEWECGLGTYSGANTLTRTTVTSSSNADAAVTFSAGSKHVYITMPAVQVVWAKERLTANRTYYVRTDGSNSNTGLANTAGGAFLTIQKAIDVATGTLLFAGFTVTIQIADGTYTGASTLSPLPDSGTLVIQGNSTTPSNVVISITSASCFTASGAMVKVTLKDLKMQTTTSGYGIYAANYAVVSFANVVFGACASHHIRSDNYANVTASGAYSITGGSGCHLTSNFGGYIRVLGYTITITGTPAFSSAFASATGVGIIYLATLTFSGSATGKRYDASANSIIYLNGLTLPGDVAGTTATGGITV